MQDQSTFQVYNASAGSGKTFTLVKEYLKILLKTPNPNYFKHILAVTFTNKAAAEMKERIIKNLRAFVKADILLHKTEMFEVLEKELSIGDTILHQRSKKILKAILDNYSAFNIITIDSFTHRLIRSFAFDLGLSLNFDVEMDTKSLLNEAVELLLSKIGEDKQLTKVLIDFSLQKANEDKYWDISRELNDIAQILLSENNRIHVEMVQEKPLQDFINLKTKLFKKQQNIEKQFIEIGEEGLKIIESLKLNHNDFYRSMIPNHFKNLAFNFLNAKFYDQSKLKERIEERNLYAKSKPEDTKTAIDSIINPLLELYRTSEKLYQKYTLNKLFLTSIIPLAVLSNIKKTLDELMEEKNIRLHAEFNQIISKNLQEQPVAFIYERIGEKFRHYFIDEMQDTSILQWQNLIPLIDNALSQEGTSLLLVGDTKQSIYRWRGGQPEQFLNLTKDKKSKVNNPFFIQKKLQPLDINYRSYSEIINFNNNFFQHVSSFFNKQEYADMYVNENQQKSTTKEGGYVQLFFIEEGLKAKERDVAYAENVLNTIHNLTADFNLNEICVLTRTRKQGVNIANFLTERDIDIISSETLLLQNSDNVNFIINLLNYLKNKYDKSAKLNVLYFLYDCWKLTDNKHDFFNEYLNLSYIDFFKKFEKHDTVFHYHIFKQLSLYESIEYVIRSFNLNNTSDAYIQFFLDEVLQFSQLKSNNIGSFLEHWEDKKDDLSIVVPEQKNAVKIMTIHKSKGLEFPVVIYPYDLDIYKEQNAKVWYPISDSESYNDFDALLINYNKSIEITGETGKELYQNHRNELELDNFNLLYVVLTRAIEQLYIIGEAKKTDSNLRSSSQFFLDYLKFNNYWSENKYIYSFGNSARVSDKSLVTKTNVEFERMISSSWQSNNITIVANSSILWDESIKESISYGNLIHEMLAKIKTKNDIDEVIETYISNGILDSMQHSQVSKHITSVVTHKDLKEYYQQNLIIHNEREILTTNNEIIIPDRLVINNTNEAVIIDYKTGNPNKIYHQQLNNYALTVEELGYKVIKKLLVYIGDSVDIEEVRN